MDFGTGHLIGLRAAAAALAIAALAACGGKTKYPPYSPHENLLSIAAEFQLLSAVDPYRERLGKDLTGQSIARATLVRLANYEAMHPRRLTPEVLALKGRALELAGEYESARRNYIEAAEFDTELREDCRTRAEALAKLIVAAAPAPVTGDLGELVQFWGRQSGELRALADATKLPLYSAFARLQAEEAEVRRAELMAANRNFLVDGEAQALQAIEAVLNTNRDSARAMEHALRLAHFHRDLAEEEVRLNPPERAGFSADRFKRHYDAALDLFYRIAQADGSPERLVARHELDAWLAFGEQVAERSR